VGGSISLYVSYDRTIKIQRCVATVLVFCVGCARRFVAKLDVPCGFAEKICTCVAATVH
jgi:hypothetical protein